MNDSVGVASMGWNREYRLVLSWSRVDHGEEHHDEGKHLLGFEVTLVDPEPAVLVLDRYKCVTRHGLSAVNTNQPDHARNSLTMFKAGKCPPSRQVFGGHSYFRRHGLHHAEDRARNDRNLRIVAGHSAEPNLVLSSAGIQLQQSPQFPDVRQDFRRNLFRAEGHEAHQLLAGFLLDLDPHRTRKLDLTCQGTHAMKVRIGRRNSLQGCLLISQAID